VHWRSLGVSRSPNRPDLYCLHPAPFSGLAFSNILPFLAQERRALAPDYPGHGSSYAHRANAQIDEYAKALESVIVEQSRGATVDLLGFHSGCLVAVELALSRPDLVRRLVLIDVPAFDAATRATLLTSRAAPFGITAELSCLQSAWAFAVEQRVESLGLDRGFELFAEQLRHGRNMNAAFHAAFTYDVEDRLSRLATPTVVLATQSPLLETSRRAAGLIPGVKLVERLDIKRAVLDEAAALTAEEVNRYLTAAET
jgi:pimeloyl-ACP methyl ester carboxylesterase